MNGSVVKLVVFGLTISSSWGNGHSTLWDWGAFKMGGVAFRELYDLWPEPERGDEYVGTLVNAYISSGGRAVAVRAATAYVDVAPCGRYRKAMTLLSTPEHTRNVAPRQTSSAQ